MDCWVRPIRRIHGVLRARRAVRAVMLTLALGHVACTVHQTDTPALTGPSGATGSIPPIAQTPTARFSFAPASPLANSPVVFDGQISCAGLADPASTNPCPPTGGAITKFHWDFGDGARITGPVASHSFDTQRTFNVTLTVTNDSGRTHSTTRPVTVGAGLLPTAAFVVSPTTPLGWTSRLCQRQHLHSRRWSRHHRVLVGLG